MDYRVVSWWVFWGAVAFVLAYDALVWWRLGGAYTVSSVLSEYDRDNGWPKWAVGFGVGLLWLHWFVQPKL